MKYFYNNDTCICIYTHTQRILHVVSLSAFLESRLQAAITMRPSCVLLLIRAESALFRVAIIWETVRASIEFILNIDVYGCINITDTGRGE